MYRVGDLVAIERVQFAAGSKIRSFLGPYGIVAIKEFNRYSVKKEGNTEGAQLTESSADKIKSWPENNIDENVYETENEEEQNKSEIEGNENDELESSESDESSGKTECGDP